MGERGPAPKRSTQRRRRNEPESGVEKVNDSTEIVVPEPDDEWHKAAKVVWDSLSKSGQSLYFTSSDWAVAWVLCESISREMKPQPVVIGHGENREVEMQDLPPKGASLAAWRVSMAALLMTEGDRRRVALELQRPKPKGGEETDGNVSDLDAWRARTGITS